MGCRPARPIEPQVRQVGRGDNPARLSLKGCRSLTIPSVIAITPWTAHLAGYEQLRQLGDVGGDSAGFIAGQ
jgi:hypothetical protein